MASISIVVGLLILFTLAPGNPNIVVIVNDTVIFGNPDYDHTMTVESNIFLKVIHADGSFDQFEGANVITNAALIALKAYISDTPGNAFLYIGVGTGSGGGAGSTELVTQHSTRGLGTYSSVSDYVFKVVYTFTAGFFSDTAITETALFNAASSGTMLNYHDFTSITLSSTDSLEVTHQITLSSA